MVGKKNSSKCTRGETCIQITFVCNTKRRIAGRQGRGSPFWLHLLCIFWACNNPRNGHGPTVICVGHLSRFCPFRCFRTSYKGFKKEWDGIWGGRAVSRARSQVSKKNGCYCLSSSSCRLFTQYIPVPVLSNLHIPAHFNTVNHVQIDTIIRKVKGIWTFWVMQSFRSVGNRNPQNILGREVAMFALYFE